MPLAGFVHCPAKPTAVQDEMGAITTSRMPWIVSRTHGQASRSRYTDSWPAQHANAVAWRLLCKSLKLSSLGVPRNYFASGLASELLTRASELPTSFCDTFCRALVLASDAFQVAVKDCRAADTAGSVSMDFHVPAVNKIGAAKSSGGSGFSGASLSGFVSCTMRILVA